MSPSKSPAQTLKGVNWELVRSALVERPYNRSQEKDGISASDA
jgi:hypothetical protein